MVSERLATEIPVGSPDTLPADRSMLVLQYAMAAIALLAVFLLAVVR